MHLTRLLDRTGIKRTIRILKPCSPSYLWQDAHVQCSTCGVPRSAQGHTKPRAERISFHHSTFIIKTKMTVTVKITTNLCNFVWQCQNKETKTKAWTRPHVMTFILFALPSPPTYGDDCETRVGPVQTARANTSAHCCHHTQAKPTHRGQ